MRWTASSSRAASGMVPRASRKYSMYSRNSPNSPVAVTAFFSQASTKSSKAFKGAEVRSRAKLRVTISIAARLFTLARWISCRTSSIFCKTAGPPSTCLRVSTRLESLPADFMAVRSFSGSMLNCGKAAIRNTLAASVGNTIAPRHASMSRTSGVSSTSMFSMENGMPR